MKKTALYDNHIKNSARMVDFGGWQMPIQYSSIIKEHEAVRNDCGIFDCSHMGQVMFEGRDVLSYLDYLITNNISKLSPGKCLYTPILYENGTFVDDIILYSFSDTKVLAVVNSSNIEKDMNWFQNILSKKKQSLTITDLSSKRASLAIQGKNSWDYLQKVFTDLKKIPSFSCKEFSSNGTDVIIATTGYTGEPGVELFINNEDVSKIYQQFIEAGVTPCGLGARDSLRLEKGYSLYGHEIDDQVTPVEAALMWTVSMDGHNFIGKSALQDILNIGAGKKLHGFIMSERSVAREGYEIVDVDDTTKQIGHVTSGTYSPTFKKNIGLCYISANYKKKEIKINIRNKYFKADIAKRNFI